MATPRFMIRLAIAGLVVARGAHQRLVEYIGNALGDEQAEALHIDEIFEALGTEVPHEPERCVCGRTEHSAIHQAVLGTYGVLDNGEFGNLPVTIEFGFIETDALAVTMDLTLHVEVDGRVIGHDTKSWTYARAILDGALSKTGGELVGDGDISAQLDPHTDDLHIWLTHVEGSKHRLTTAAEPVRNFMITSFRLVPDGQETADVDDTIARLLEDDQ